MQSESERRAATTLGILAILFWSLTVALSRALTEQLGVFTAACCIYLGGGLLGCLYLAAYPGQLRKLGRVSWRYWFGCGGFFVANILCFHLAVGLASDGQKIVELGLMNYLWISLTLILSVPILGKKAHWTLALGILMACAGIVLAALQSGPMSWEVFVRNLHGNRLPYVLVLSGAVSWALYSNLSRRWGGDMEGWPIPVFLLVAGLLFLAVRATVTEQSHWSPRVMVELGCTILLPTILAYLFWDAAMRKGTIILVVSASYLTPLLSTLVSCAYLRMRPGPGLVLACALVISGAVVCRRSIED